MAAPVVVVQGASRGLGLEFCKQLLKWKTPAVVIATCRHPDACQELQALAARGPGTGTGTLSLLQLDVDREDDVRGAAERVAALFGGVDLMINCSAMLHPSGRGETSLRNVSAQGVMATVSTNTVGPLLMAKYFSPLLMKGGGAFGAQPPERSQQHRGLLVNMTARVGSIGDNALGGWYSYRLSKAALNMVTKTLSVELGRSSNNKVVCVSLHPGTVATDLSAPYHRGVPADRLFSPQHSVSLLLALIQTLSMEHTGGAYSWDGAPIPW
ncbi:uncharacterized protein zgc:65997 [Gadus morhua]|uniref:C-factor n=1 Tax=Gadus morhua TaxID=8049 RepID=A0A8C5C514_GADMO|nr:uncharacterized protein LOC115559708 [Gadus morhua]